MGLFDQILGSIAGGDQHQNLASSVLEMLTQGQQQGGGAGPLTAGAGASGGLNDLVSKMNSSGLGDVLSSWISTGQNLPVSSQQMQQVLGPEVINQLVQKTGIHVDSIGPMLAQVLPQIIDKMSPNGQLPQSG